MTPARATVLITGGHLISTRRSRTLEQSCHMVIVGWNNISLDQIQFFRLRPRLLGIKLVSNKMLQKLFVESLSVTERLMCV